MIHVIHTVADGQREMPTVLQGEAKKPVSGLGSNAHNASIATSGKHPVPRAAMIGGAFSHEDFDAMRATAGADHVPWLMADPAEVKQNIEERRGPPSAKEIAERAKKCFQAHGLVPGADDSKDFRGVWCY